MHSTDTKSKINDLAYTFSFLVTLDLKFDPLVTLVQRCFH